MVRPFIILPLYIYPLEKAWNPLLDAARQYPDLRFLPVINPSTGPGETSLPDTSYVAALRELSSLPNIHPMGYIHLRYGNRPLDVIFQEIDIYRGWNAEVRLSGIFFDESPSDPNLVSYMAALAEHTKVTWEADLSQSGLVIYNPGVVVESTFFQASDYIVVFEQSEEHWNNYFVEQGLPLVDTVVRNKSAAIIHSCASGPSSISTLLAQINSFGLGGLLLTDQLGGGYTKWPAGWSDMLEAASRSTIIKGGI